MFAKKFAELEKAKLDLRKQEQKIAAAREATLAALPGEFGYASMKYFIKALKVAARRRAQALAQENRKPRVAKPATVGKRVKITDEMKVRVNALTAESKTGQEIARALGISAASVQKIKKQLGLVKARGVLQTTVPAPVPPLDGATPA